MGKTTGGPLLCVDDLMQDLLSEESSCIQSLSSSSHSPDMQNITSTNESLEDAFQRTYRDLELGLASSGHSWTNLTQQLYSALISANQVAATVNTNLFFLSEKIASMRLVLERGDVVMKDLDAAVAQLHVDDM